MSPLDRRQTLKLLAGLGAAAAVPGLSACGTGNDPGADVNLPAVRIGLIVPQNGVYKVIGDDLVQGFRLYLQLHGDRLGGREVQLALADEGETAATGKTATEQLLKQERVVALTGVVSSAVMSAIKDLVEESQVPLVGSNASPTTLQGVKYIWRTSYVNDEPGKALGKYLTDTIPGTVYCLAPNYQAGKDEISGLLETFTASRLAADPVYASFDPPTKNFAPLLSPIRDSGAKAVFAFFGGQQAIDFVRQYRQAGVNLPLYAPGFLTEGSVLSQQGEAARGIFTAMNYAPDLDNSANRTFAAEYQKVYGTVPTTYAMASYDAANVLDKAIALAGTDLTPQSLNAAIGRIGQVESPRGPWQFNQNRTPQQKWYLREVKLDGTVLSNVLVSELTTLG